MEMTKKTPMLTGGGFSYQLNEDGTSSIEEIERYLTDLTLEYTRTALRERRSLSAWAVTKATVS